MPPSRILDLGDDCLLQVFRFLEPLPDLFSVARTCSKFRLLAGDKRRWLCVVPKEATTSQHHGHQFSSLEHALAASRPGDTIWLAPGMEHTIKNVVVQFPVHLRGGGSKPEDTLLMCCRGADMGLDFRATCLMANMSIRSAIAPCVVHRAGHLRVERCRLTCMSNGLDHLASPIITVASSPPAAAANLERRVDTEEGVGACPAVHPVMPTASSHAREPVDQDVEAHAAAAAAAAAPCASLPSGLHPAFSGLHPRATTSSQRLLGKSGLGKLVVTDTQLSGGGKGVQCLGTGSLQDVRVIYPSGSLPLFFFQVDSRLPGHVAHLIPTKQLPLSGGTASSSGRDADRGIQSARRALSGIDQEKMMQLASRWATGKLQEDGSSGCTGAITLGEGQA